MYDIKVTVVKMTTLVVIQLVGLSKNGVVLDGITSVFLTTYQLHSRQHMEKENKK